jgi:glycosyltransferase involved in cell wall biosynthesis
MPEIVQDGITGFVVPPNNPAALSGAIAAVRADPGRAARMGDAARRRVLDTFRWEQVVERCLEAYATL